MIYGIHPVTQALTSRRRVLKRLLHKSDASDNAMIGAAIELARAAGLECAALPAAELQRRCGSRQHQGLVLECGELPKLSLREWTSAGDGNTTIIALDRVEDPQNVGGIVRSAEFLGADALLVHRSHRAPLGAVASKASAGALEYFPIVEVGNLSQALQRLKKEGYWIGGAALDSSARDYRDLRPPTPRVLVLGSEGQGLRRLTQERCDEILFVPRRGNVDSLNVHVACAVVLAHWMDQGLRAT